MSDRQAYESKKRVVLSIGQSAHHQSEQKMPRRRSREEHQHTQSSSLQGSSLKASKKTFGKRDQYEGNIQQKEAEVKDRPLNRYRNIKLKWQERYFLTEQMAMLLDAGVGIVPALDLLMRNAKGQRLRYLLEVLKGNVVKGQSISSVLKYFPRSFSALYVAMVRIGEESGQLPDIFNYLADMERSRDSARKSIQKATFYPLVVLMVAIVVVIFIMIAVVPTFEAIYSSSQMELPLLTQKVMHFSAFLASEKAVYVGLFFLLFLLIVRIVYKKSRSVALWIDRSVLKLPILGNILRNDFNAGCCDVLAIMLKSGVTLVGSLALFQESVTNQYLHQKVVAMKRALTKGVSFSDAIKEMGIFTDVAMTLISVGEMSGKLEEVLTKSGRYHRERVESQVTMLISLIDPLSMVLIGAIVGTILIALYLPMFSMGMTL